MKRLSMICTSFMILGFMFAGQSYAEITPETILGVWLLDEGTGDIAGDASGKGNDGTLINAPDWVAGQFGNALEFTGSNHVDCGNDPALNVNVFSVSFWCNIPSTQGWNHIISRGSHVAYGDPGSVNWGVMMYDAQETILYETFNDVSWVGVTAGTNTGEWHHVVATLDGAGAMQLYHDGSLAGTGAGGVFLDESRPFLIGARSDDGSAGGFFTGSVDDVGYFNTVLTPEDIEIIMDEGLAAVASGEALAKARRPDPADGAVGVETPLLQWRAGVKAVLHLVYLGTDPDNLTFIGEQGWTVYWHAAGLIPGAKYYWRVDEKEADGTIRTGDLWSFTAAPETAYNPTPCDGMKWVDTDTEIAWSAGLGADSHDVYFGTDETAVANADPSVSLGNQVPTSYRPGPLAQNTSYYWRIDEQSPTGTHEGAVWSFTTTGPVPANAGLKAFYFDNRDLSGSPSLVRTDPEVNFNWGDPGGPGAPIGDDEFSARWLGEIDIPSTAAWIFSTNTDDGIRVWVDEQLVISNWTDHAPVVNTSKPIELTAGRYSIQVEYYENAGGAVCQLYWESPCVDRQIIPQAALSPPLRAGGPSPSNGATGVSDTPTLKWSSGEKALQHDVYFGTDQDAVAEADTTTAGVYRGRQGLALTSYTPTENPLEWDATYYWRIDEVSGVDVWKGSVWNFTTADYIIVDDFEDYNDYSPHRIFQTWLDGWGYTDPPPGKTGNGTGSTVGYLSAPFAEQTTIHGGRQSMPFGFDNTGAGGKARYSEAEREFLVARNFTRKGVKSMSVWVYGDPNSTPAQLYVGLQDSAGTRVDVPDTSDSRVQTTSWQEVYFELSKFSPVNLASVKKIYIGVGNRLSPSVGGTGNMFVDDIRLYGPRCVASLGKPANDLNDDCIVDYLDLEIVVNQWLTTGHLVTPTDPGTLGLVAYYPLDGDTQDASGNGHHGTAVGGPTFVNGPAGLGTGMTFTPAAGDDWVECGTWDPSEGTGQLSVSIWMNWSGVSGEYMGLIGKRDGWAADDMMWHIEATQADGAVNVAREPGPFIYGYGIPEIGVWEHVAFTFDGSDVRVYRDGTQVGSGAFSFGTDPDALIVFGCCQAGGGNPFNGALDEIRLYNRPLSQAEIAWLAGKTAPFSAPFDLNVDDAVDFLDVGVLGDAWLNELLWPAP
ncbi:MAG: hypothetical protein JSU70_08715 [Phycisphaerales bacterium]|nr:MAG: hypothetical protein JSU70_08715 [Phycisphaerales bacterium]